MIRSDRKTIYEILGREPVHPFPARMAPGIALEVMGEDRKPLRVLDPMMGSGTVLAVARSKGHRGVGVDIDPLAVLISKVWTTAIDAEEVRDRAREVLDRARGISYALPCRDAYPRHADVETRAFVAYWFDRNARRQLTSLATAINRVRDDGVRDALWCAFSRLIITKQSGASLAMDLAHSRPHRAFDRAPTKPFLKFLPAVDRVVGNCVDKGTPGRGPAPCIQEGDARDLPIGNASVDLVLTSPPYLNAIDYMRCSKFSLVWMGHNVGALRQIRGESVGAEASSEQALEARWVKSLIDQLGLKPVLSNRDHALLARYVWDMGRAIVEVSRVLRRGGRAVYVIGDCMSRGTFIPNSSIVTAIGQEHGLSLVSRQSRALPANRRYLPPPKRWLSSATMDARLRREVVVVFNKP